MKISQLLNENIASKLDMQQFPLTVAAATGPYARSIKYLTRAIEVANEAIDAGQIIKSRYTELRGDFSTVFDDVCKSAINSTFYHAGKYEERVAGMESLFYDTGSFQSFKKVLKTAEKFHGKDAAADAIVALYNEWKPVLVVLDDLKGKVTTSAAVRSQQKAQAAAAKAAIPQTALSQAVDAAIEKHKPQLVKEYEASVARSLSSLKLSYTDAEGNFRVPMSKKGDYALWEKLRKVMTGANLDPVKVKEAAQQYADMVAESMKDKIMFKAGELQNPEVRNMSGWEFLITGEVKGSKVYIEQNMILNCSSLGTLFNQFPARIYVDGKFMSEAAYKTWMNKQ